MRIIGSLLLFINSIFCHAQREADAIYHGGCFLGGCWCSPPNQGNVFQFDDDSLVSILDPACISLSTYFSKAAFSDQHTGELLFASNGWRLVNGQGDVLEYKLWFNDIPHPGDSPDTTTVNYTAGPLFLNDPADTNQALLFYGQRSELFNQAGITLNADIYFTYAVLDIPSRSLISKNNIILGDTSSSGDIQACRHGNGRDWWIIKPHMYTDFYFIGLLDPSGLEMNLVHLPNVPHLLRTNSVSKFNIQGNKYIQYTGGPHELIHEYDFDRCEGILSNLTVHEIGDSIADNDILSAISISPDGSKFYFKRNTSSPIVGGFYQYDLSNQVLNLITRRGQTPQMMPNGKKLLFGDSFQDDNNQLQRRISEITNPNSPFNELNTIQFKYNTPNAMLAIAPSNFAYFRLGAEAGSVCDSLSFSVPTNVIVPDLKLEIYPNPVDSYVNIEHNIPNECQIKITDIIGRVLWIGFKSQNLIYLSDEIKAINSGIYWIEILDLKSGKRSVKKLIKQ
jgi:hypothetical protein